MRLKQSTLVLAASGLAALAIASCSSDDANTFPGVGGSSWGGGAGHGGADASSGAGGVAGQGGTAAGGGSQGGEAGSTAGAGGSEAGAGGNQGGAAGSEAGAGGNQGGAAGSQGGAGGSQSGGAAGTTATGGQGGNAGLAGMAGSGGAAGAGGSLDAGAGGSASAYRHDDAADPAYDNGWTNGTNGGTGFGPWLLNASIQDVSHNGFFLGTSSGNGPGTALANIDTAGRAFGLYANGNNGVATALSIAWRPFNGVPLAVGETVVVRLDTGYVEPPEGMVGVSFPGEVPDYGHMYAALPGTTTRFVLAFRGGSNNYETSTAGGWADTGVALQYGGLKVSFQLTGAETYALRINDGAVSSGTLGGVAGTALTGIAFFNYNAGPGGSHDLFCNSLEVYQ